MSQSAYLLVFHGSRDPRPAQEAQELARLMEQQLPPHTPVYTASLEAATYPLHEQIIRLGNLEVSTLKIIPLFLLLGVHVSEDIPHEVEQARKVLAPKLNLELCPYLGSYDLNPLLLERLEGFSGDGGILLAHGSRRSQSHASIEARAAQLGLICAYWAVAPSLATQVEKLVGLGKKSLIILPYFLFAGGTTQAIATEVFRLQEQFSSVELCLGQPFNATAKLAQIILTKGA